MDVSQAAVALILRACHKRCDPGFDGAVSSIRLEIDCNSFPARANAIICQHWCALNMSSHTQQRQQVPNGSKCVWCKVFCRVTAESRFWQLLRHSVCQVRNGKLWSLVRPPVWDKLNRVVLDSGQLFYSRVAARRHQSHDNAQAAEELCQARARLAAMPRRVTSMRQYTYQGLSDMFVRWRAVAQQRRRQRELDVLAKRDRTNRETHLSMLGNVGIWLKCGPRPSSFPARLLLAQETMVQKTCGPLTVGGFFQAERYRRVRQLGTHFSAVRQRVRRCAPTHPQFAPVQLLICLLCVEKCIACGSEKQCQTGLVRPSCGDSCCARDTCEPSCGAE